ncbi:MAG TPA: DUF2785 domain-containing protein [Kofleriaceae bacterium]|jgi:hypothetical protein|nr:DUF2785 domain-containing protein [Kofleriaceae bacterium]
MIRAPAVLVLVAAIAACRAPAPVSPAAPPPAPAPTAAASAAPPAAPTTLAELEAALASPDPERRDRVAYETLSKQLLADGALDDDAVAGLRDRLIARTAGALAPGDAVFGRSFAALTLSVIAAREVARPIWTEAILDAQIAAASAYAARELDLRGHTGTGGWAHAAAHTADWLKFLARHPRLTAPQAVAILDAVTGLVARRHGARFSHGEDERLAAAARAVLRRGLIDDAAIDGWLGRVADPLTAGWPDPFDPTLYAAQRNARDLLVSLFVALSFDDAPPAAAALARLRAFMSR